MLTQEFIEVANIKSSNSVAKVGIPGSLRIAKDGEKLSGHVIRVMTAKDGDKRVVWDADSLEQINDAKAMFDDLVAQGLVPYRVGVGGKATSEVMDEFDAAAEEILFLPVAVVCGG